LLKPLSLLSLLALCRRPRLLARPRGLQVRDGAALRLHDRHHLDGFARREASRPLVMPHTLGFEPVSAETQPVSRGSRVQISDIENLAGRDTPRGSRLSVRKDRNSSPETRLMPLTYGNVVSLQNAGAHWRETAVAGWGARIRTWEWRKLPIGWLGRRCDRHLPNRETHRPFLDQRAHYQRYEVSPAKKEFTATGAVISLLAPASNAAALQLHPRS
jgi:hypothetical protein